MAPSWLTVRRLLAERDGQRNREIPVGDAVSGHRLSNTANRYRFYPIVQVGVGVSYRF
jgi:hypothetical protein